MKAFKKITSCNDLGKKICTGSSKTFLRYPGNPPQITRFCNFSFFNLLLGSVQNLFLCVSDLKVICTQSWGHIEETTLRPQKSQIKLTIASFLSPNQMEHMVYVNLIFYTKRTNTGSLGVLPECLSLYYQINDQM